MCHCWNNLGMKGHVPSLVKMVITLLQPRLPRTNRKPASVCARKANACRQILAARILPEWLISFPSTCYDTRATFTVWALWLATDSKAAILNMKGFFFFFRGCIMQNIKCAKNICDSHSFPVYTIFFSPPPCQHDTTLLFLRQPNSRLLRAIDASTMPEQVNILSEAHKCILSEVHSN